MDFQGIDLNYIQDFYRESGIYVYKAHIHIICMYMYSSPGYDRVGVHI